MQSISVFNANRRYRLSKREIERYVSRVLGRRSALISVVFVDSLRCKAINGKFLRHDVVTDVISFTLEEQPMLEGEIYVNLDRAMQQAKEYGVSFANEVARLVIHGMLHLTGHEDKSKEQKKRMRDAEDMQLAYWFSDNRKGKN